MGWGEAIAQVGRSFFAVFQWVTGGRSRREQQDEETAERLEREAQAALARGDVADVNRYREQLKRLRDKAIARYLRQ